MIRLYGHEVGEGSFSQVTRGVRRALEAHSMLAGMVALDNFREDTIHEGAEAPISINCGNPFGIAHARLMGLHEKRWLLLAPNSENLSQGFVRRMTQDHEHLGPLFTGLLAPSKWAMRVLQRHFPDMPVVLAPHGVTPGVHKVNEAVRSRVVRDFADRQFRALHMSSTGSQRKGTRELLRAWSDLKKSNLLPRAAVLCVVIEPQFCTEVEFWAENVGLAATGRDLAIRPGFGMSQEEIAALYSYSHVIVQPSRAEGFGLVPLEARACGVPIVATDCTGHADHVHGPGAVVIPSGPPGAIDDFDNSTAPTVEWEAIASSLRAAYESWSQLDDEAGGEAAAFGERWAWETVLDGPLHGLGAA